MAEKKSYTKTSRCWPGYEPVAGKSEHEEGSCRKKPKSSNAGQSVNRETARQKQIAEGGKRGEQAKKSTAAKTEGKRKGGRNSHASSKSSASGTAAKTSSTKKSTAKKTAGRKSPANKPSAKNSSTKKTAAKKSSASS